MKNNPKVTMMVAEGAEIEIDTRKLKHNIERRVVKEVIMKPHLKVLIMKEDKATDHNKHNNQVNMLKSQLLK